MILPDEITRANTISITNGGILLFASTTTVLALILSSLPYLHESLLPPLTLRRLVLMTIPATGYLTAILLICRRIILLNICAIAWHAIVWIFLYVDYGIRSTYPDDYILS